MEVQTTVDEAGNVHKHYVAAPGEHVVMTGPVTGVMTLSDGKVVNVTSEFVAVDSVEQADELADMIGQHWAENGHPDDIDIDEETGDPIQQPFVYVAPSDNQES